MLNDVQVRKAAPGAKPVRTFDGGCLSLEVRPAGGKWWRFKYRFGGKEKLLALGTYPDVSLKQLPDRRDTARKHLSEGASRRSLERLRTPGLKREPSTRLSLSLATGWRTACRPGPRTRGSQSAGRSRTMSRSHVGHRFVSSASWAIDRSVARSRCPRGRAWGNAKVVAPRRSGWDKPLVGIIPWRVSIHLDVGVHAVDQVRPDGWPCESPNDRIVRPRLE